MENNNNKNLAMSWDDVIEKENNDYVLLPEGDYVFKVVNFERAVFPGSDKIPTCNKAVITVKVNTNAGEAVCKFDLILYRTLEWKLYSFFRCIGQKKHGEQLRMDWTKVIGSLGMVHFKPREYKTSTGENRAVNEAEKFIDYNEEYFSKFDYDKSPYKLIADDKDLPF